MAKRNLSGTNVDTGAARQQNQQARNNAEENYEFSTELGAGNAAGMTGQGSTAARARQRNQQATQNAAAKAGRTGDQ